MKKNLLLILTILMLSSCKENLNHENLNVKNLSELEIVVLNDDSLDDNSVEEDVIKIYMSVDRTGTSESGISIEQGILTAFDEINYKINGKKFELVIFDHRGSTPRAKEHLDEYLNDSNALVLFSGLHSPPLLTYRDFINENKILLLDPWAAAGPISRYNSSENWIFRLSIDDTKAGYVITNFAVDIEGFKSPYLILEETGWGESNNQTMTNAIKEKDIVSAGLSWFNWNLGINQAKVILREAKTSGADVIFFVGNAPEGKVFANAMAELEESERLPIRSHWGITGGDFPKVINNDIREEIDIAFIQSSFSFINMENNSFGEQVFNRAKGLFDSIDTVEDIEAPAGFIHSYDLTRLLIAAISNVDLTGDIVKDRDLVRLSLESLNSPIEGLIKIYNKPFSVYSGENVDAHEALSINDFVMAIYGKENEIIILEY